MQQPPGTDFQENPERRLVEQDRTLASARKAVDTLSQSRRVESFVAGTLLLNQYEIIRRIGSGGMGSVYKCKDQQTNRLVAVKVLRHEHASNNKIMQRFQREAQAIASIEHANLVKLYTYHADELTPMLIMEYVDGKPLDVELEGNGGMTTERAIKIAVQICDALAYVHHAGIIHRDLKPSNIILKKSLNGVDQVKVVDFGIAKMKDLETSTTSTGEIFGSPSYMSPEQAIGKEAGEAADQYALGCILFECLTGFKPFISDNPLAVMMQHIRDVPPSLKEASLGKDFPAELQKIVTRLMEKEPERRFSSMTAVKDALTGKHFESDAQRTISSSKKNGGIVTGNPILFATIISSSTLVVVALLAAGWFYFQKSQPLSKQEAGLNSQALQAEKSLSQSPSNEGFGVEGFDSPAALLLWLKPRVRENKLEIEYVFRNSLSPEAVSILSQSPQINSLSLAYFTKIKLLRDLKNQSIQELDLSDTDIDDTTVKYLTGCPNLESLRLMGCLNLTSKGYANLCALKSLKRLALDEAVLTDGGVKELVGIPNLSILFLNNRQLTANCLVDIARMPNLTKLKLAGTNPDGKLPELIKAKKLTSLDLAHAVLKEKDIEDLTKLKNLISLDLAATNVTNEQLKKIASGCPRLGNLAFNGCPQISNQVAQEVKELLTTRRAREASN